MMFFSENMALLVEFQQRLKQSKSDAMADACSDAVDIVVEQSRRYDRDCKFMPEQSGQSAAAALRHPGDRARHPFILYFLTGCIREVTMIAGDMNSRERDVLSRFKEREIAENPGWEGWHSFYEDLIFNLLPLREMNRQLSGISERRDEMAALESKIKDESLAIAELGDGLKVQLQTAAKDERRELLDELNSLSGRIEGYRDELKKQATDYNFVGLSHAFKELIAAKASEVKRYAVGVAATGLFAIAAPVGAAFLLKDGMLGLTGVNTWSVLAIMKFVGLVGIELVLLYYFRIALKSFLLAKDQHANLSLRLALCQFIEGYCDFSGKTKDKGIDVMKGFEELVFSPLPANDKSLPATIDGLDGIVNIVAALKAGK